MAQIGLELTLTKADPESLILLTLPTEYCSYMYLHIQYAVTFLDERENIEMNSIDR